MTTFGERDAPVVGYVVRMFPQTSETFIANELLALQRLGVRTRIYSYRRPRAEVRHAFFNEIEAPVTCAPDPVNRNMGRLLRAARDLRRKEPARFGQTVRYVARHSLRSRSVDTWRRLLQAAYLSSELLKSDVRHLHAHFAHGATRVTMLASMLTGLPYSFTAHAHDIFNKGTDLPLLREKAEGARFVVTVSDYNRRHLAESIGMTNGRVRVLYNGVDLERFSPDPSVSREDAYILGVGRFVEKKGFGHLIEALRILRDRGRDFRCDLVGSGPLRRDLERAVRAAKLDGKVTFVGAQPQEALPSFYRRATLLAMPAVVAGDGNRDALPTVLLEAMACATPVISTRLSGIPEIVEDDVSGLLVEPGDPAALAVAIDGLLGDPTRRERLGGAARAKTERAFDARRNAEELRRLFRESVELAARP